MIQINNNTQNKTIRKLPDLIEPYIIEELKRVNHTFFIYRCSNYNSFQHLISNEKFDIKKLSSNLITDIEKYWTAIDAIYLEIAKIPEYHENKEYFNELKKLSTRKKTITNIHFYEIKIIKKLEIPNLSVKTYLFSRELKKHNKEIFFIKVFLKGFLHINYDIEHLTDNKFNVRTHYGNKNKTIKITNAKF